MGLAAGRIRGPVSGLVVGRRVEGQAGGQAAGPAVGEAMRQLAGPLAARVHWGREAGWEEGQIERRGGAAPALRPVVTALPLVPQRESS